MAGPSTSNAGKAETIVRGLCPDDRAAWEALFRAYIDWYRAAVADDVIDDVFARLVDGGRPDMAGLVALRDGHIVGLLNYVVHGNTWAKAPVCYLEDLYVDASARCTGAARTLIEVLTERGREAGWHRIYWMTQSDNHKARTLYDRVGTLTDWVRYNINLADSAP